MGEKDGVCTSPKQNFYFCLYEDGIDTGVVLNVDTCSAERNYYTVTFADGEKILSEQIVLAGQKAAEPDPLPKKEGMTFGGWMLDGTSFDPKNTNISKKTVLQAKWIGGQGNILTSVCLRISELILSRFMSWKMGISVLRLRYLRA
ncbi:MAG: InlB B-repeat-containing protein [Lachnospiraceae bacterium]|jgi:hypothetical protein|nr:InlB B-repeat-containing protein [Lachnospiraceae bacterium]